jgi:hypothetical protein
MGRVQMAMSKRNPRRPQRWRRQSHDFAMMVLARDIDPVVTAICFGFFIGPDRDDMIAKAIAENHPLFMYDKRVAEQWPSMAVGRYDRRKLIHDKQACIVAVERYSANPLVRAMLAKKAEMSERL